MEEKRKEELTKFFTVSSAVLSVLYAACILLSLLAPLLPKFIPLLAFFLFFLTLMIGLTVKEKAEDLGHMEKGRFFFVIPLIPLLMLLCYAAAEYSLRMGQPDRIYFALLAFYISFSLNASLRTLRWLKRK